MIKPVFLESSLSWWMWRSDYRERKFEDGAQWRSCSTLGGASEAWIKGTFVRMKRREEIGKRLKRLNLVIVIKKYWQVMGCILRGSGNCQGCLWGFQWDVDRNREIRSQGLFAGGGSIDNDFRCSILNSLCKRISKGRCLADRNYNPLTVLSPPPPPTMARINIHLKESGSTNQECPIFRCLTGTCIARASALISISGLEFGFWWRGQQMWRWYYGAELERVGCLPHSGNIVCLHFSSLSKAG